MNKRIHKILRCLFISSTAFLWIACSGDVIHTADDVSESNEPHSFIDIEKELSNLKKRDMTGLIGTTVTGYDACITRIIANGKLEYDFIITDKGELEARKIVETKIDEFLESPKGASLSESSNKCYTSVMNGFPQVPFDDDVKLCGSYSEEITLDDQNIKNLLEADEISLQAFKESLEKANELLAGCDSLE
jgi:hypothetical protein